MARLPAVGCSAFAISLAIACSCARRADEVMQWSTAVPDATARARAEHRPMLLDFTARWHAASGALDAQTFIDPRVIAAARRFVAVKIDISDEGDEVEAIEASYGVANSPTILVFDAAGKERARFSGFVPPADLAATLEKTE